MIVVIIVNVVVLVIIGLFHSLWSYDLGMLLLLFQKLGVKLQCVQKKESKMFL